MDMSESPMMEHVSESGFVVSGGGEEKKDKRPHEEYQVDDVGEESDDDESVNSGVRKNEKEQERPDKKPKLDDTAEQSAAPEGQPKAGYTNPRSLPPRISPTLNDEEGSLGPSFDITTFTIKGPDGKYTCVKVANSLENQELDLSQAHSVVRDQLKDGKDANSIETSLWELGYTASVKSLSPAETLETLQMSHLVLALSREP
jgi:hypothetical protein